MSNGYQEEFNIMSNHTTARAPKMRIYGASCLHHGTAPLNTWKNLAEALPDFEFNARWPGIVATMMDLHSSDAAFQYIWDIDVSDIQDADVLMLYALPKDNLRGAVFEAGVAIGQGKPVLLCGENQGFSTWQFHRNIVRVSCAEHSVGALCMMAKSLGYYSPED